VGRRLRSFGELSPAEVAIFAFLHVSGQVCPDPATLAINHALLLKLTDRSLPTLDRGCMTGVLYRLLIPGSWDRNGLHDPILAWMSILIADLLLKHSQGRA
jgi:hypothetical protein